MKTLDVDNVAASIATPDAFREMKRDTVRPIDPQDAEALRLKFGINEGS